MNLSSCKIKEKSACSVRCGFKPHSVLPCFATAPVVVSSHALLGLCPCPPGRPALLAALPSNIIKEVIHKIYVCVSQ